MRKNDVVYGAKTICTRSRKHREADDRALCTTVLPLADEDRARSMLESDRARALGLDGPLSLLRSRCS